MKQALSSPPVLLEPIMLVTSRARDGSATYRRLTHAAARPLGRAGAA
jgi:hypothetical protein